ncbi:MAG: flagellar biosynthetic protein FliQ, partial [Planctomycetes bacterium]|nr:flagellar biosynthetic protein FliQ [Planctomycetota bacterium]
METAIELSRGALSTAIELALPVMVVGLAVGVIVSVFQAMTQVHDQTLSFIPKILAMVAVILLLLPWFLKVM